MTPFEIYRKSGRQRRRLAAGSLKVPLVIEHWYVLELRRIIRAFHRAYKKHRNPLRHDAKDPETPEARMSQAMQKAVGAAFDKMARGVRRANKTALATISPSDTRLDTAILQFRERNIALMAKAGQTYVDQVREIFDAPESFGMSVGDLAKQIQERADVSESRAELIARDQTLKLNGQINMVRQTNAGIDRYEWSTSHDERVRESHQVLDGKVFSWAHPPEVGHPGEDFQCRCIALPVFDDRLVDE